MLTRKVYIFLTVVIMFLLGAVSVSQAAPPLQEGAADTSVQNDNDDDQGPPRMHPVANALAQRFQTGYNDIMSFHQQGYGFGQIMKAHALAEVLEEAEVLDKTPEVLMAEARQVGWGRLLKDNGLHPSAAGRGLKLGKQGHGNRPAFAGPPGGNRPAFAGPPGGSGPPGQLKKGN
jgi:hypothetical protein